MGGNWYGERMKFIVIKITRKIKAGFCGADKPVVCTTGLSDVQRFLSDQPL